MNAQCLESLFDRCFTDSCGTVLRGGAEEPLYTPASVSAPACIRYREDFVSSALHEVAHWCIAGRARRESVDYGYWYAPDGRTPAQQVAFERVEARPQALEWIFAQSCASAFSLSLDNLAGTIDAGDRLRFAEAVVREAEILRSTGLPPRAKVFASALRTASRKGLAPGDMDFPVSSLASVAA